MTTKNPIDWNRINNYSSPTSKLVSLLAEQAAHDHLHNNNVDNQADSTQRPNHPIHNSPTSR